jgi:aminoglycoside phosphotransferase (APT) family kinase protein
MDFVEGRIFWDPTLPAMASDDRRAIYREMNRVLAALHAVDPAVVGLADYGRPGNYFERQIRRWTSQYESAKTETNDAMERLIDWLPKNVPSDDSAGIVHGDYRLDNMVFDPKEPRILAVLDWELSTLDHPLADLAYNCLPYHFSRFGAKQLSEVDPAESGLPTEAQYVAWYCERTGRSSIDHWPFYLAFSLFRLASITQGVYKRGLQGNASSERASDFIRTARATSAEGWRLVAATGSLT